MRFKRYVYLITGAILMANLSACSGVKFEKYCSKDPLINLCMDYIGGWQYDESRGSYNSYAQVMFFPFKKGEKSSKAVMVVTLKDSSRVGLTPLSVEAVVDDLLAKRMKFKDAKILSRSKVRLLDSEAEVIELTYLALEDLLSIKSKLIPAREKIIIFQKGNNFYFLRYKNSAAEFNKYAPAFKHIVETIKIGNS